MWRKPRRFEAPCGGAGHGPLTPPRGLPRAFRDKKPQIAENSPISQDYRMKYRLSQTWTRSKILSKTSNQILALRVTIEAAFMIKNRPKNFLRIRTYHCGHMRFFGSRNVSFRKIPK